MYVAEARRPEPPIHYFGPRPKRATATERPRSRERPAGDVRRLDGRACLGRPEMGRIYGERNRILGRSVGRVWKEHTALTVPLSFFIFIRLFIICAPLFRSPSP